MWTLLLCVLTALLPAGAVRVGGAQQLRLSSVSAALPVDTLGVTSDHRRAAAFKLGGHALAKGRALGEGNEDEEEEGDENEHAVAQPQWYNVVPAQYGKDFTLTQRQVTWLQVGWLGEFAAILCLLYCIALVLQPLATQDATVSHPPQKALEGGARLWFGRSAGGMTLETTIAVITWFDFGVYALETEPGYDAMLDSALFATDWELVLYIIKGCVALVFFIELCGRFWYHPGTAPDCPDTNVWAVRFRRSAGDLCIWLNIIGIGGFIWRTVAYGGYKFEPKELLVDHKDPGLFAPPRDLLWLRVIYFFEYSMRSHGGGVGLGVLVTICSKIGSVLTRAFFVAGCIWVWLSSLKFITEEDNEDMNWEDGDGNFLGMNRYSSIPQALYYTLVNLTGEFPNADDHNEPFGKLVCMITVIFGYAMFAVPVGILGWAFQEYTQANFDARKQQDADPGGVRASIQYDSSEDEEAGGDPDDEGGVRARGTRIPLDRARAQFSFRLLEAWDRGMSRHLITFFVMGSLVSYFVWIAYGEPNSLLYGDSMQARYDVTDANERITQANVNRVEQGLPVVAHEPFPPKEFMGDAHVWIITGGVELGLSLFFAFEYVHRVMAAPATHRFTKRYVLSVMGAVDLYCWLFPVIAAITAVCGIMPHDLGSAPIKMVTPDEDDVWKSLEASDWAKQEWDRLGYFTMDHFCLVWVPWMRAATVLRMIKLERQMNSFGTFRDIMVENMPVFRITGLLSLSATVFAGVMMFYAEKDNPDEDMSGNLNSVGRSLWMTALELTGEAPLADHSAQGKAIHAALIVFGQGLVAVPMGLFSAGYMARLKADSDREAKKLRDARGVSHSHSALLGADDDEEPSSGSESDDAFATKSWRESRIPTGSMRHRMFCFLQGSRNAMNGVSPWPQVYENMTIFFVFLAALLAMTASVRFFQEENCQLQPPYPDDVIKLRPLPFMAAIGPAACEPVKHAIMHTFLAIVIFFTLDYGLRVFAVPNRLKYIVSPTAIIEACALVPFWVSYVYFISDEEHAWDEPINVFARVFLVLRLMSLNHYVPALSLLLRVLTKRIRALVRAMGAMFVVWMMFTTILNRVVRLDPTDADDRSLGSRFGRIEVALQVTLVHLTGDYPLVEYAFFARIVHLFVLFIGMSFVAVPAGILASCFSDELQAKRSHDRRMGKAIIAKLRQCSRTKDFIRSRIMIKVNRIRHRNLMRSRSFGDVAFRNVEMPVVKKGLEVVVILSIMCTMVDSVPEIHDRWGSAFLTIDFVAVACLAADWIVRLPHSTASHSLLTATYWLPAAFAPMLDMMGCGRDKAHDFTSFETICESWGRVDLALRMLRLFILDRSVGAFKMMRQVWSDSKQSMAALGVVALVVWLVFACLWYVAEGGTDLRPAETTDEDIFPSLFLGLYWAAIFLHGEWPHVDFNWAGRIVCVGTCVVGVAMMALPVGRLCDAFSELVQSEARTALLHAERFRQLESKTNELGFSLTEEAEPPTAVKSAAPAVESAPASPCEPVDPEVAPSPVSE